MLRIVKRIGGWGFWLAVAGALVFGGLVAVAKPANAMTCPDDGWNWLGQQPSAEDCQTACELVHGGDVTGQWGSTNGCCRCLY
jgi:hypothetical protein